MQPDIEAMFAEFQGCLKRAAELAQAMFEGNHPATTKARYEATTKIEEAYMWAANGVQAKISFDEKVEAAATEQATAVANGAAPTLTVVK